MKQNSDDEEEEPDDADMIKDATKEDDGQGSEEQRDQDGDELDNSQDLIESDENEVQIYYEAEEIEANRRTQAADQFEELLRLRVSAATPQKNRFNIRDYMPKDSLAEAKKLAAMKKKKRQGEGAGAENGENAASEMELVLEDDSEEKDEPDQPDPDQIRREQEEAERAAEAVRQQAILQKETNIVANELEELIYKAENKKLLEEQKRATKAEHERAKLIEMRDAEFEAQQDAELRAQKKAKEEEQKNSIGNFLGRKLTEKIKGEDALDQCDSSRKEDKRRKAKLSRGSSNSSKSKCRRR